MNSSFVKFGDEQLFGAHRAPSRAEGRRKKNRGAREAFGHGRGRTVRGDARATRRREPEQVKDLESWLQIFENFKMKIDYYIHVAKC